MNAATIFPDATSAVQTVLAVSVLIALVLVARRPVAKHFGAGTAYTLWALPLARLVLPPLQMPVSLMPLLRLPKSGSAEAAEPAAALTVTAASEAMATTFTASPSAPAAVPPAPLPDTVLVDGLASPQPLMDTLSAMLLPGLFIVWASGALFVFGLSLWRQHVFMQTVKREAVNVSPRLQHIARQVGAQVGLNRLPVVASSFISSGPLVTGLARPVVLLPAWFETDYDDTQQRAALAHELTHVRRGDLWALQLAEIFIACMWFNPLAYYAHRAFRTDQEAACDADVLKTGTASPHAYGATLIKAVKSAAQERPPAAASLPLTHALKERLSRMTHPVPTRARRLAGGAATAVIGAAALIATSSVPANAGEREHRELRIENGTVYLNGELIPDRRIIVLGEPFEGIEPGPEVTAEIDRLSQEMAEDGKQISQITAKITSNLPGITLALEDDEEFQALMAELNELPVVMDFNDGVEVRFEGEMSEEDWEEWGRKWGEWGEKFGARAESWAAAYEAEVEDMHAGLEPELARIATELETRLEEKSIKLEALIDEKFGKDFELRIGETSAALDDLVAECRDASLSDGETKVLSRTINLGDSEKTVKIACVKGNEDALRSAKTLAVINSSKALCDVEKESFREQVHPDGTLDGGEN
ncbi:M56 family metallopeptidase [Hyphomonas jannaschiana]|uniref:M56 family metallopeptidase n=1 Tax=Hyphomonas jannaschiana TaxID=86 RepID=UPI0035C6DF24